MAWTTEPKGQKSGTPLAKSTSEVGATADFGRRPDDRAFHAAPAGEIRMRFNPGGRNRRDFSFGHLRSSAWPGRAVVKERPAIQRSGAFSAKPVPTLRSCVRAKFVFLERAALKASRFNREEFILQSGPDDNSHPPPRSDRGSFSLAITSQKAINAYL
ncbi:hypothetical protein [Blastochloris viridis]|uniref:hypothetical protein n=1 Tax=Blastochloris viridis TaxID=1079 RepID=UPI00119F807F|nr:hypothetical protein [Blastochloris viridis]